MKIVVYIALFFGLLLSSCAPNELPEDLIGDPVFYTEGTIDGAPFSLLAGPNDVEVLSSYDLLDEVLPSFNVSFTQLGCENCEELNIDIVGGELPDGAEILTSLPLGEYTPFEDTGDQFSGGYIADFSGSTEAQLQLFLDPNGIDDLPIIISDQVPFVAPAGTYNYLFAQLGDPIGCLTVIEGVLEIEESGELYYPQLIAGTDETGDYIDFGDFEAGQLIINQDIIIEVTGERIYLSNLIINPLDIFDITFESYFETEMYTGTYTFPTGFDIDCFPNIEIQPILEPVMPDPLSVAVSYGNSEGMNYSIPSGSDDFFIIHSLTPYSDDPSGREAYTLSFTCGLSLSNSEGSALQLEITEGIIPIVIE